MRVTIVPSVARGTVTAPPSKSLSHRALICGALTDGSTISNIAYSQDIEATLSCLEAMGAQIEKREKEVRIGGLNPFAIPEGVVLDCGESGSTLRFLLPLCLLSNHPVVITGSRRLMERPLGIYEEIFRGQDLRFEREDNRITVCGPLQAGAYSIAGNISSQFISGLLLALPLLNEDCIINVTDVLESASYVSLTMAAQSAYGVCIRRDENRFLIHGGQRYASNAYTVEGDCSNAAFLDAFNLLGGCVKVMDLSPETAQGDWVYHDFYRRIGVDNPVFDLADCPDLGPVMFALAAAMGGAKFIGTARLRLKESDRITAMVQELAKFGATATVEENSVKIHGCKLKHPTEVLNGHNDHRIVMALSLLCTLVGGTIDGAQAVAKSYPDYFDVLRQLCVDLHIDE